MDVVPKNWYENWFGNEYLTLYAHRGDEEAKRLIKIVHENIHLSPDALIIDLCCGQGRHARTLAESGYRVVGVDLSRTMLEAANFNSTGSDRTRFIQADMRQLPFGQSFDLLLNLFTSFGYFNSDEENQGVFVQFRRVLKDDGWFIFDYLNDRHVKDNLVARQKEEIGNIIIELERFITDDRVQKKIVMTDKDKKSVFYESVKMYRPDDIYGMIDQAGLVVNKVFGDYDGSPFLPYSPRLVIIGSRKK